MTAIVNNKNAGKARSEASKIEKLRGLSDRDLAIWQFFEKRADDIKVSLWTTATWLIALKAALLAFMLSNEHIVEFTKVGIGLAPKEPTLVLLLSALGLVLTFLTLAIVSDFSGHVRRNWQRASEAEGVPNLTPRGRKIFVMLPLYVVIAFFVLAFFASMYFSFDHSRVHLAVVGFVAVALLIFVLHKVLEINQYPSDKPLNEQEGLNSEPSTAAPSEWQFIYMSNKPGKP
jgi:hypothetical protein